MISKVFTIDLVKIPLIIISKVLSIFIILISFTPVANGEPNCPSVRTNNQEHLVGPIDPGGDIENLRQCRNTNVQQFFNEKIKNRHSSLCARPGMVCRYVGSTGCGAVPNDSDGDDCTCDVTYTICARTMQQNQSQNMMRNMFNNLRNKLSGK